MKSDTLRYMFHVDVVRRDEQPRPQAVSTSSAKTSEQLKVRQVKRDGDKLGRNEPCPCGSGKKYKRCHGAPGAEPLAGVATLADPWNPSTPALSSRTCDPGSMMPGGSFDVAGKKPSSTS